jgi:hypothetical protein
MYADGSGLPGDRRSQADAGDRRATASPPKNVGTRVPRAPRISAIGDCAGFQASVTLSSYQRITEKSHVVTLIARDFGTANLSGR